MTAPPYFGCVRVLNPGWRFVLGELDGGGYGIWTAGVAGGPHHRYPAGEFGWQAAYRHWLAWEHPEPIRYGIGPWLPIIIAAVVIMAVYLGYHAYRYGDCVSDPGIFSWPSHCI